MKTIHQIVLGLNSLISVYFIYLAIMHSFVYFANKSMGHEVSFFDAGRYTMVALFFLTITVLAWFLIKQANYSKLGLFILYIPLIGAGLFGLWTIILILSSGGKWN